MAMLSRYYAIVHGAHRHTLRKVESLAHSALLRINYQHITFRPNGNIWALCLARRATGAG
ncbi:protein of unknown function (plasmid) [Cupriavidus taiwanensis]|uniref:Uncharacterized protein n=1 Tax=Cupriavidus taiwanensis TaxID=164546 RepID=A0A375EBS9_9BURK|nr:protein of unknown function [Cupriavidus taiwanensis]SOZ72206.1 protein of unknown function [Cupriavidus taiwanensis]SOZ74508.1 protein of unknown function [Cupriavidus taiwanensis]SPA11335.1 protein of unknown function [Cupriavidus taiwanensis]SPA57176.1 protein of unknown function [Cupriavidus taiwanensis]